MKFYALAVCFATLLCGAITFGLLAFNIVKIAKPEFTIDPTHLLRFESNERYRQSAYAAGYTIDNALAGESHIAINRPPELKPPALSKLTDEQIEKIRKERREHLINSHVFRAKQAALAQSIILFICGVLFYAHWRIARKLDA